MLRNALVEIPEEALPPLQKDEFYHRQIIGLMVITSEGKEIGRVAEIMETGSNDVYVVRGQGKEYLIPAIKDVILSVDLRSGAIIITPMEGLLD